MANLKICKHEKVLFFLFIPFLVYSNDCSEVQDSIITINACDSYNWNGNTYEESGSYTINTFTINGCDSSATLNLTIFNSVNDYNIRH